MKTNLLIATSKAPQKDQAKELAEQVRLCGAYGGVAVQAQQWTEGPGCANFALACMYEDPKQFEKFANVLTMALMPAKWTTTTDEVQDGYFLK